MKRLFCVIFTLFSASFGQDAGPFGLRAGMTRKQVEQAIGSNTVIAQNGDTVTYSTAPHSHPLFEKYVLIFSRKYGLVMIQAISRDIDDTESGQSTGSKCEEIHSALVEKYGKAKQNIGCRVIGTCKNDVWSFPTDPAYSWSIDSRRSDKVETVGLMDNLAPMTRDEQGQAVLAGCGDAVSHHARWIGLVTVTYVLANYSKYQDELKSTL
jgi:hypothetical protein